MNRLPPLQPIGLGGRGGSVSLTPEEREAIAYAHLYLTVNGFNATADTHNATLARLLARLPETSTPEDRRR